MVFLPRNGYETLFSGRPGGARSGAARRAYHRYPSAHQLQRPQRCRTDRAPARDGRQQDGAAARRLEIRTGRGGAAATTPCVALARQFPKEYVFFANELPDIPEARPVIEKYLKMGAIGIGEQKFPVEVDSKYIDLVADDRARASCSRAAALRAQALQFRHREFPQGAGAASEGQFHRPRADLVGQHRQEPRSDGDVSEDAGDARRHHGPAALGLPEHVRRHVRRVRA